LSFCPKGITFLLSSCWGRWDPSPWFWLLDCGFLWSASIQSRFLQHQGREDHLQHLVSCTFRASGEKMQSIFNVRLTTRTPPILGIPVGGPSPTSMADEQHSSDSHSVWHLVLRICTTWDLVRNANDQPYRRPSSTDTLWGRRATCVVTSPLGDPDR
jgi:hypothetical protein